MLSLMPRTVTTKKPAVHNKRTRQRTMPLENLEDRRMLSFDPTAPRP